MSKPYGKPDRIVVALGGNALGDTPAEQIEKGDGRASSRAKPAAESAPRRTGGDDLARLEGILKNIGG